MSKIPIIFEHNRGFVYNVDDYFKLRTSHRLVCNLIGVPVSKPRDARTFGLPAILSPLELKLAIENGIGVLVDKTVSFRRSPTDTEKTKFQQLVEQQTTELKLPLVEKRLDDFRKHLPQIIKGKRKKLLEKGIKESEINITSESLLIEERRKIETMKIDGLLQIPSECPLAKEFSTVELKLEDGDKLKYQIFKDLWTKQNVFISGGDAFGCDFLLYPGDPLYYHASHMVYILSDPTMKLDVKYLIRCCRLSVVVNKICIFAYENDNGEIKYQTMDWDGNAGNENYAT
ncbi:uncharacterized protein LOC131437006 [Malaya genurostris]|uniref:uncharacterized protein LOC131437006 n=1 Tax=Malaya genurostris TaxID=325434 RepID=UPI0026F39BCD|nr:uncharacterized protein LOC131437006 [Malaya genurostris]XP_058462016.1 uncharacterized protein LOC131437006 [Malaya genurostris]